METRKMAAEKRNKFIVQTVQLADRLAADIRRRNLKPGETYLTAQEASRYLGVAGASANRALQLLEKRKIIRRSQRRGAVVLEPPRPGGLAIDHVHFLVHDKYYRTEGVGGDGILLGIQSELPTSIVSHCFLSSENEVRLVAKQIEHALTEKTTDAFVMVRASYDVQRMVAESGLPAIVFGNVYEGIDGLSQIDRDHETAIRLVADYFRQQGRTRLVVLMRQQVMPGDHLALDALLQTPSFSTTLRFTPSEDEHIEAVVRSLLLQSDAPNAFLCQTIRQAECVEQVRRDLKLPKENLDVVVLTTYLKPGEETSFPYVVQCSTAEETGRRFGILLLKRAAGKPPTHEVIPVKLVVPKQ